MLDLLEPNDRNHSSPEDMVATYADQLEAKLRMLTSQSFEIIYGIGG